MTPSYTVAPSTPSMPPTWHQSSPSKPAKHVRFAPEINTMLQDEFFDPDLIKDLRNIFDDLQYHLDNPKIRGNTLEKRQISFQKNQWPIQHPSAQQLIDAGFCYAPEANQTDITHCFTCDIYIDGWDHTDDAYEGHLQISPDCLWLKEHRGKLQAERQARLLKEQQQAVEEARLAKEQQARLAEEARIQKERLKAHIVEKARVEKERLEAFACRRCPAKFPSNTKLHQHVHDHHQKRPATPPARTPPTPPPSEPTSPAIPIKPAAIQTPPTPPATPTLLATPSPSEPTLPATPRRQISWAAIASKPASPKPSRLPRPVPKFLLSATPTPAATKAYLTMDDLFAMFTGKPMPIGLIHRQKDLTPPKDWRPSKPVTSHQTRITSYFLPSSNSFKSEAVSKSPLYFPIQASAPRCRRLFFASTPPLCGQIINSAPGHAPEYHSSYETPKAFKNGLFKAPHQGRLPPAATYLPSTPPASLCSPHTCRFCYGTFSSNNGLHRHLRSSHLSPTPRWRQEKTWDN